MIVEELKCYDIRMEDDELDKIAKARECIDSIIDEMERLNCDTLKNDNYGNILKKELEKCSDVLLSFAEIEPDTMC